MTSHSLIMCTFLLLLFQALAATIPAVVPRRSVPAVPDVNDSAFQKVVLDKVNTYRSYQDASALEYDASLANYAAGLASQCDIDPKVEGPYGDVLTGGSPAIFSQDTWDGFTLNEAAADLIDGWYNANASYIADPAFQFLSFGRSYTQLVWKATTAIGCAWTPPTCDFDDSSAYYLRCAFSPKGNIAGQFEDNVSCHGCPDHVQGEVAAESTDLQERQSTGSAFGDLCLVQVNYMRAKAGVPLIKWDGNSAVLAKTLAQKCNAGPQQGETVGHAFPGFPGYIPTWDATLQTFDTWDRELHTSDRAKSPNYAQIVSKGVSSFGCGWNDDICPGSTWYMHCFFGNWDTGAAPPKVEKRQCEEHSISTRQTGELGINMDDYYPSLLLPINNMRKDAGLPEVKWSHSLVARTQDRGATCSDFRSLSVGQLVQNQWWSKLLDSNPNFYILSAGADWNNTKPASGVYDTTSHEIDYFKITQPKWASVGCSWSRNCTAADNYVLYCEFSDTAPTRRAIDNELAVSADLDPWLQNTLGQVFANMRAEANIEKYPDIWFDALGVTQSQTAADKCDGNPHEPKHPNKYPLVSYRYDEAREKLTEKEMTINAIATWIMQGTSPNPKAKVDYLAIIDDTGIKHFGCAWSTKCGSIHYLFCSIYPPNWTDE